MPYCLNGDLLPSVGNDEFEDGLLMQMIIRAHEMTDIRAIRIK